MDMRCKFCASGEAYFSYLVLTSMVNQVSLSLKSIFQNNKLSNIYEPALRQTSFALKNLSLLLRDIFSLLIASPT